MAHAAAPGGAADPPPILPAKLPAPKISVPEAIPANGDSAWDKGWDNLRKTFGPSIPARRSA